MVLKWFKDQFCEEEKQHAAQAGTDVYDMLCEKASRVPAGSDGLVVHLEDQGFPSSCPPHTGCCSGLPCVMESRTSSTRSLRLLLT